MEMVEQNMNSFRLRLCEELLRVEVSAFWERWGPQACSR